MIIFNSCTTEFPYKQKYGKAKNLCYKYKSCAESIECHNKIDTGRFGLSFL